MRSSKWLLFASGLAILAISASGTMAMAKPKTDDNEKKEAASTGPLSRAQAMTLLVDELKAPLARGAVRKIAVLDLTDLDGNCSALGRFLAEELTTGLSRGGEIEVVERNRLRQLLTDLNEFSAPEPETYKTLQQSLGVDAVVVGTLTPLGDITRINLRVIATDAGRVVTAGAQEFGMDAPLVQLIKTPCREATASASAKATTSASSVDAQQAATPVEHEAGLWGQYFNWDAQAKAWPQDPVLERSDALLNFNWRGDAPAPRLNRGAWGAGWRGQIHVPATGVYTFHVSSGGRGCEFRIDGKLLVSATGENSADARLEAGWHDLSAGYHADDLYNNRFVLTWATPGETKFDRIPGENFRHAKKPQAAK